jgi:hypothetical protein
MSIFQIAATLFALFMLYVVTIHRRKAALSSMEIGFWYSTWIIFIIIAIFPNLLLGISGALKFARVFDLLVVGALMILTVVLISSYLKQRELTKKLEVFISHQAINDANKKQKK